VTTGKYIWAPALALAADAALLEEFRIARIKHQIVSCVCVSKTYDTSPVVEAIVQGGIHCFHHSRGTIVLVKADA
jgi:hypothetical protein